MRAFKKKKKHK